MPWEKGQSGNPGGRPKTVKVVQDLARLHTEAAINTLAEIAKDKKAGAMARVAAATEIINRGYGRAPASIELNLGDTFLDAINGIARADPDAFGPIVEHDDGDGADPAPGGFLPPPVLEKQPG